MPVKHLRQFLDERNIKYVCLSHSAAYTSQEIAEAAHVSGKSLAKTVIAKQGDNLFMVVIPADKHIDFDLLYQAVGGKKVELANEIEFAQRFPECDLGMMPPFGNLYGMPVFVDSSFADEKSIVFNAGKYTELVQMNYQDYIKLVKPTSVRIA